MSSERTNFRVKLQRIYEALCEYTDDVVDDDTVKFVPYYKLTYAVIIQAIDDLHFGNIKENQQAEAIEYLRSEQFQKHCDEVPIPNWLIHKIVYNPDEYASHIKYTKDAIEEECWI